MQVGRPPRPPARRAGRSTGRTGPYASARGCVRWPCTPPSRWCASRRWSHQYPLNDKLYYPVYATCAELGLPVSVNVGVPGPRCARRASTPSCLEDVLIDFKGLTVIGAHMGHPYEALLMQYMLKWPDLYLSNSAYLAKYMDPALGRVHGLLRGMGRVLFASDHPFLPMERAVAAARDLPLSDAAADAYPGRDGRPAAGARMKSPGRVERILVRHHPPARVRPRGSAARPATNGISR